MLTPEKQKLAADNVALAYKYVHKMLRKGSSYRRLLLDKDDLYSIALLALCNAARDYEPESGYAFSTYVYRSCCHAFSRLFRDAKMKKHRLCYENISLDAPVTETDDCSIAGVLVDPGDPPDESFLRREQAQLLRSIVRNILPPDQSEIVHLYYWGGIGQPQIAQMRNTSQASISRALSRAHRSIANELKSAGYDAQ